MEPLDSNTEADGLKICTNSLICSSCETKKNYKYRNGLKPSEYALENYNSLKRYKNLKVATTSSSSRPLSAYQNGQTILLPSSSELGFH